jgi:membrane protease YdiL (CAAX protease family)
MAAQKHGSAILLFLLFTILFSGIFWALIIAAGHIGAGGGHYVEALMWCPALAALLTIFLQRLDFGALGLSTLGGRYAALGYVLPLAYAVIAYAFIWGLGFGFFPDPAGIAKLSERLGWHLSDRLFVPLYFLLTASTGMVGGTARALGEEIGWRGFLAPRMVEKFGFTWGAIAVGAIWAAWHLPLLLFADYNNATEWWFAMSCFAVMVIASSVILTWLRLRSQSVWPCAIFHASHNVLIQSFFTPLTGSRGPATAYAVDEFGLAVPAVVLLFAFLIWRDWNQAANREPVQPR